MRGILFRGKNLCNGWSYGDLVHYNDEATIKDSNGFALYVDPETVGQYTGLTDKNGTKIFEGDIVTTDLKLPYLVVEFRDASFMFRCNDGDGNYYDIMLPILDKPQTAYKYGEVISNIHDNSELLEENEND